MLLPTHLLPTTVVGSYPQPDWLVNREMLSKDGIVTPALANNTRRIIASFNDGVKNANICLLYTSPSPRDRTRSRMPSSA